MPSTHESGLFLCVPAGGGRADGPSNGCERHVGIGRWRFKWWCGRLSVRRAHGPSRLTAISGASGRSSNVFVLAHSDAKLPAHTHQTTHHLVEFGNRWATRQSAHSTAQVFGLVWQLCSSSILALASPMAFSFALLSLTRTLPALAAGLSEREFCAALWDELESGDEHPTLARREFRLDLDADAPRIPRHDRLVSSIPYYRYLVYSTFLYDKYL